MDYSEKDHQEALYMIESLRHNALKAKAADWAKDLVITRQFPPDVVMYSALLWSAQGCRRGLVYVGGILRNRLIRLGLSDLIRD